MMRTNLGGVLVDRAREGDQVVPDLGHVFHGKTNALSPEAALLHAAVWHVIDTPRGHVAYHDAADIEFVPRLLHLVEVAGEYAGLQAEHAVVDFRQGDAVDLGEFQAASFDLVFSTYTFQYIERMAETQDEIYYVLGDNKATVANSPANRPSESKDACASN